MAFNEPDFLKYIQRYSDPTAYGGASKKALAWGALASALLSAPAKQNLVPGYMSGVERVQEMQMQERMMDRMAMQDMMGVYEHQANMRQMEQLEKIRDFEMKRAAEEQKSNQEFAKFISGQWQEQEKAKLDQDTTRMKSIADFIGKMSDIVGKMPTTGAQVGAGLGKVAEKVTEFRSYDLNFTNCIRIDHFPNELVL